MLVSDTLTQNPGQGICVPESSAIAAASPAQAAVAVPISGAAAAVVLLGCTALLGLIYRRTFVALAAVWDIDPNYSHGYFVPLAALWFAHQAWQKHGGVVRRGVDGSALLGGILRMVLGLALHFAAVLTGIALLDVLSLVLLLRGLTFGLGGRDAFQAYGFAALFLLFMAPLPMAWYQPPAVWMQQVVSEFSTWLLNVFGISAFREGYKIHLTGYTMEVGEACSGLRQLTAVVALAAAVGHLSERGRWFGWVLAAAALPIAVLANSLRIVLTGASMLLFGSEAAEGVFHTGEGLLLALAAAGMLAGTAWLLARLAGPPRRNTGDAA